jgi:hypothetical protein
VDDAALSDAAKLALDSPVVTQAVALSRWIAESGPRPLTPRRVLRKPDIPVAAAVIGVALPENPRTAADVPALNRPWNLALDTGLLRADGDTVTAGPALATWPPGDPDILAAWLDGLLTVSGSETGSPWDDTPATDILVFLTAVQEAADGVSLRDQLIKQAAEIAERVGLNATFFWPEKRIANTTERLASFGAIGGGEVTSLGRWAAARLLDRLAEPDSELTAAELIAYLADCDEDERDEYAWAWLDAQPDPAEAARQLLMAGASMEPRLRWITADVVGLLQEEAVPVWREMAAVPGMGPHAKFALFTMEAGPEPDQRTVLIPATANLAALHLVIQALYGWDGDHLHAFRVRRVTYSDPSFSLEQTRDEYAMRVLTALKAGGGKITYEYDFGAGWIHEIALQEKVPREPGAGYPFCVKYSGDSPVEYPDYDSDKEQQPEPFDLEAVNRRLAALGAASRES